MMETALLCFSIILFPAHSFAFMLTGEVILPSFPIRGDYDSSFSMMRSSSSLNDNGDFYIPGINDNETDNQSTSIPGNYLSSLLNIDYSSNVDQDYDSIPTEAQPQPVKQMTTPPSSSKSSELHGLTDDGDFMMVGINSQDPMLFTTINTETKREPSPFSSSSEAMNNPLASFFPGGPKNNNPDPIMEATTPSPATRSSIIHSYQEEEEQIGVIEEFLSSLLPPSLNPNELKRYAHQLCALGFDPDCETSGELKYEDLDFMKRLHQRYFWIQWEKLQ
jgi:hypothetical protein